MQKFPTLAEPPFLLLCYDKANAVRHLFKRLYNVRPACQTRAISREHCKRGNILIVLHGIWEHIQQGKLYLWAESSDLPITLSRRVGRQGKTQKARPHPFVLTSEQVKATLSELGIDLSGEGIGADLCVLQLPSAASGPLSSPELIHEEEKESRATAIKSWEVQGLLLNATASLNFLLALSDNPPSGLVFGSSLRFWMTAARLAFELLVRQSYMPVLRETNIEDKRAWTAAWEAVLSVEDSARLTALSGMMPPVCWSFLPGKTRPAGLPRTIVQHFLNQIIDAFVRRNLALAGFPSIARKNQKRTKGPSVQWLMALTTPDSLPLTETPALGQFAVGLQGWLAELQPASKTAAFRTCFRLDAPEIEDAPGKDGGQKGSEQKERDWRISFYLQANDDQSLLVPAEQVWRERSSTLTFLKHSFENPQERLLTDLGKASRLFAPIEESLKTARPEVLQVKADQAYAFLREATPLLEQSGFGVLVPSWWHKPVARLGVKLKVQPKTGTTTSSGLLGLNGLVTYDWTVSVGDINLTDQEFEKLVSLKMPLISVRGQWVELRPEEIEKAIAFFQKKRHGNKMTLAEALRTGLGQELSTSGLPVTEIEGDGWVGELLNNLSDGIELTPIQTPATFQGKLRPYQLKGVAWLAFLCKFGLGGCLADDMGLGKTIELITLLLHEREQRQDASSSGPALLICPMSIVGNWQREIQRFAPSLKVMIHHGHERLTGEAFTAEALQNDIVITTYALALRDREHLTALHWQYVVVDEAQNIKNEVARQTQAIKSIKASNRIALTGTPVENRLSELWSIMDFLNPGYLGSAPDFQKQFALPIERYHQAERAETLKRIIQPFLLRRVKTDKAIIADLPEKLEMQVFCNLTQEQATLYEAVVKEMLEKIEAAEEMERRGLILATLLKLKQVCNHPAQFLADGSRLPGRSGKLARLEEMVQEVLAAGEKALIFSQFAEMGTLLRRYLQEATGREVLFLYGGTPKKQRDSMVQRFQEDQRAAPLFVLSLKAGGVGLNLTAANHVFHFDRWWNPAVENQATDRAFRIGQRRNVQVHKFVCVGTLEERIDQMIEQKKELAERIVGNGEGWLTEMSTAQLRELFTLSREAVGE